MKRILLVSACLALLLVPATLSAQQAIFVVRHAERLDDSNDSPLSEAGVKRAQVLATLLKDAGITAIYASGMQRTIKTAEPLAQALKLDVKRVPQYDGTDVEALASTLRAKHAQDVVLVVGHSNTMPALVKALGSPETIKIGKDEYDVVFLLAPKNPGPPTLLRLRFN